MLIKREFYINGRWVAPITPRDCEVIDPSTEEPCAIISLGSDADTDAAVAAAIGRAPQVQGGLGHRAFAGKDIGFKFELLIEALLQHTFQALLAYFVVQLLALLDAILQMLQ